MSVFCSDVFGRRIQVLHYDVPSVGGRTVVCVCRNPQVWLPDTEWTARMLEKDKAAA